MDRRIRIRHLQALTEIVRQGSMKRAAERLFLTQPAISRTLSELEDILGAELLIRGRAGISLTPQGEFFHGFALNSLSALEQGVAGLKNSQQAEKELRVGALPSVAARLMPEAVAHLAEFAPDIRLTIADGSHEHLTRLLKAGDLDVVIGRLGAPEMMQGLSFTQLYLEEVAIVARPDHPALAATELREIFEWPVIFPPPWAAIRPLVERFLIAEDIPLPRRRIETVSGAFGRAYVQEGDAIWLISAGVVAREIEQGRLARLTIATGLTAGPVGMMIRVPNPETVESRLFARAVRHAVEKLELSLPTE